MTQAPRMWCEWYTNILDRAALGPMADGVAAESLLDPSDGEADTDAEVETAD